MINTIDKDSPFYGMYAEMKEKADKEGHSKNFLDIAQSILTELRKAGFTPKDIESGDGHFIIATGENSVWQFGLDETPGWLWGIWLDYNFYGDKRYRAWLFGQFKETMDKFKPSASVFEKAMFLSGDGLEGMDEALETTEFVRDNPYRAFAMDNRHGAETEEEGKKVYDEWIADKKAEEDATAHCDAELEKAVKEMLKDPIFKNAKLHDMGPLMSYKGRYRIVLDYNDPEVRETVSEPGLVKLVEDGVNPIEAKTKELREYAHGNHAPLWNPKYNPDTIVLADGDEPGMYDRWNAPFYREDAIEYRREREKEE